MNRTRRHAIGLALAAIGAAASAQGTAPADAKKAVQLDPVEVKGHYDNSVGSSDAASGGVITPQLIEDRPLLRPGNLLEYVPGMVVTQHSGAGKANQYFLRGFNLDHGTDFSTWVAGMPVNLRSHGHGQGYTDLNFIIPELISGVDYWKGPYYANIGDFSSAGGASMRYFDSMKEGVALATGGNYGYGRALARRLGAGRLRRTSLTASSFCTTTGPGSTPTTSASTTPCCATRSRSAKASSARRRWLTAESGIRPTRSRNARSTAGWSAGSARSTPAMAASRSATASRPTTRRRWRAGNSRPLPTGSSTSSTSFPTSPTSSTIRSTATSSSRPTIATSMAGPASGRRRASCSARPTINTLGYELRQDRIRPVGLYSTLRRERLSTTREDDVIEGSAGIYGQNDTQWNSWFRSLLGLRYDRYRFNVDSNVAENSGNVTAGIWSPKASLIFGPWDKTEYFVNLGSGFHSNDARGVTIKVDPKSGDPVDSATPLVRSTGAELGLRTRDRSQRPVVARALVSEARQRAGVRRRRGHHRGGTPVAALWRRMEHSLAADAVALPRPGPGLEPRTIHRERAGRRLHPRRAERGDFRGIAVDRYGPWSGALFMTYIGSYPLLEDNSVRSKANTTFDGQIGYAISPKVKAALRRLQHPQRPEQRHHLLLHVAPARRARPRRRRQPLSSGRETKLSNLARVQLLKF